MYVYIWSLSEGKDGGMKEKKTGHNLSKLDVNTTPTYEEAEQTSRNMKKTSTKALCNQSAQK